MAVLIALVLGAAGYALWQREQDNALLVGPMVTGLQRQNELTVFAAQVVTVPTTRERTLGGMVDRSQTSIVPARVRYTIDLSHLTDRDVRFDEAAHRLRVTVPPVLVQAPALDDARKRVFRTGPPAAASTWDRFDRSNSIKAGREARTLAASPELMRLAQAAARDAIAANATLFLRGAKVTDVTVDVRFAGEGARDGERMERSRSLREVYAP